MQKREQRVWLIIQDARVRDRLAAGLNGRGFTVLGEPALDESAQADAVIVEFPGPRGSGREALLGVLARQRRPVTLVLCPHGTLEAGLAALKEGADDFVLEPFDPEELEIRLERALAQQRALAGLRESTPRAAVRGAAPALRTRPAQQLRGGSPEIRQVRELVDRVAPGRATVLITGETGTGKELIANLIHESSPRRDRPLVKVNCAALPDPLLESELFGHEKGAFTGAEQRRIGRFEEANGGTLFLDEIGDMHLRTQAKVLRALQEQEFERLGGANTVRVDVRVVAATNQDLRDLMARGQFREDLFFRLNVVPIRLPALRDHADDIPALAEAFLAEFAPEGGSGHELSPDALARMCGYRWPGNVRELRNVMERAVLIGDSERVEAADLGLPDAAAPAARVGLAPDRPAVLLPAEGIDCNDAERQLILQALERSRWVQKDAAKLLRMSRRKLNYRISRLGITHPGWRRNRAGA